jgi:hypothetical protein
MGMYTELIFGASFKKDTPDQVIQAIKYMLGERKEKPSDFPLPEGRCEWLFQSGSFYFAVDKPVNEFWYDNIKEAWTLSVRGNIKNYAQEIETFLEWVKPYIKKGAGAKNMYAIVMYEESEEPQIYYLN